MATQTNNFTRSNVNAATLQITDPGRSSFNLGHKNELTIPFGKIVPVSTKILLPSDTFSGSLKPKLALEKIGTPSIGATRLDTHTFVVNFRRINKDLRQNMEQGANFFPSLDLYSLLDIHLGALFSHPSSTQVTFYNFIKESLTNQTTFKGLVDFLLSSASSSLWSLYSEYDNFNEMYYQKDKYLQLSKYYETRLSELKSSTYSDNDPLVFFQFGLPVLVKPFMGPSSLLDYLGYPYYSQYNKITSFITSTPNMPYDRLFDYFKTWFTENPSALNSILFNGLNIKYNKRTNVWDFTTDVVRNIFSELPLRAYYATWYDYLRNWHIEERKSILDPDNFSNSLVVPLSYPQSINDSSLFLSFYTLRSRDYGTDFLTSIQTDDAFRHVYSPVLGYSVSGKDTTININNNDRIVDSKTIIGIENNIFGGDHYVTPSGTAFADYVQDFQTMRRCGMLEKWLARNYYYPDTYVGRLQARFGVRPSDYEILVSQYIGGSESFISGQELVANMSTSETVVGSRSLKADVSTSDNFSGSVSDYSILISVVSTVPIVTYDVINPAARLTDFIDFPQPEFATDTRVEARVSDFLRGFSIKPFIGYVPRYYQFRVSADETHGRYLTDYRIYNWLRDNYSMSQEAFDFSLNPYSLRVNLPLNAFIGLQPWDDFAYGSCDVNLVVNRALPAAIEII